MKAIQVQSTVRIDRSDRTGLEVLKVTLRYGHEFNTYERFFFDLLTRTVPGGYAYGLSAIFNKYDDTSYQNCRAEVPGFGRVYFFGLQVSSLKGIENPETIKFDMQSGRYREWFTLVSPKRIEPIERFSKARFSIVCDGMVTLPTEIEID